MKILTYLLLAVFLAAAGFAADVSVRRVLSDHVQEVRAGEPLRFWREVCVTNDVKMHVLRTIRDLNTEPETFIKLPTIEYGALSVDGCQAAIYELRVPSTLAPGRYVYEPVGVMESGQIVYLPDEKFEVIPSDAGPFD